MTDIEHNNTPVEDKEVDERTVSSEDLSPEQDHSGVVTADRRKRKVIFLSVGLVVLLIAVIAIASVYGTAANSPNKASPPEIMQDAPTENPAFDLIQSFPEAQTITLADDSFGYMDPESGCLEVTGYGGDKATVPLCFPNSDENKKILSLNIMYNDIAVGREHSVEVWSLESSEWKRTSHIKKTVPGFGSKVALARGNSILIAADTELYYYTRASAHHNHRLNEVWPNAKGFDVTNEKFAILYHDNSVEIFDIPRRNAAQFIHSGTPSTTYESDFSIDSIIIDADGHVQAASLVSETDGKGKKVSIFTGLVVQDLENGRTRKFPSNFQWLVSSDMVYSPATGCIFSLRVGEYVDLEVEADKVHDIQNVGSYVAVAVERNGKNVVEVYEKSKP